jgi:D-sedoheptulose 7-phosphate isomerase
VSTSSDIDVAARLRARSPLYERAAALASHVQDAAALLVRSLQGGGAVFACGNGGSATQAAHFVTELVGRFKRERSALRAFSLAENSATLTALGNDYEFADVFARQMRGMVRPGDCVVALTTSGESENVVRGCLAAREARARVIVLTGEAGGRAAAAGDVAIRVPETDTPLVQEVHLAVIHLLCEIVEAEMFPRGRDRTS